MIEIEDTFSSVADAVSRLAITPPGWTETEDDLAPGPRYKYPFGFWFRGEGKTYAEGNLVPGAFRKVEGQVYDEVSMFNLFRLRAGEHQHLNHTTFDWLCLMQHYGLPTRLLDWTESPLVALFFAVRDEACHDQNGYVFALSARDLNRNTQVVPNPVRSSIHAPESFNTVIRAECANRPILRSLFKIQSIAECDQTDGLNAPDFSDVVARPKAHVEFLERLRMPAAVYPFRSNGRMIAQYGLFTVHGGKMAQDPPRAEGLAVGAPIHLSEMNQRSSRPIIRGYKVCADWKADIKRQTGEAWHS